ncbi:MAG: HAD family hydrolase [Ktedonobacterales bacterium]
MDMTDARIYLPVERLAHASFLLAERRIMCILFDLGDTLWTQRDPQTVLAHERASNYLVAALLAADAGDALSHEVESGQFSDLEARGSRIRQSVTDKIRHWEREHPGDEPNFVEVTQRALHSLNAVSSSHIDRALAARVYEALRVSSAATRVLFDDVLATLATLRELGLRLGIVTNRQMGGAPFYEDLRRLGLLDYIAPEHIAISADHGVRKPNPTIFRSVLHTLDVPPEAAAMVGNSLTADVAGAQQLNILAVWKPSLRKRAAAHARWQARSASDSVAAPLSTAAPALQAGDEPSPELYSSEDAYLLAFVQWYEEHKMQWRLLTGDRSLRPDVTITHIGDLLPLLRPLSTGI